MSRSGSTVTGVALRDGRLGLSQVNVRVDYGPGAYRIVGDNPWRDVTAAEVRAQAGRLADLFAASSLRWPSGRVTVDVEPVHAGPVGDLAVAVGVLCETGAMSHEGLGRWVFAGSATAGTVGLPAEAMAALDELEATVDALGAVCLVACRPMPLDDLVARFGSLRSLPRR